MVPELSTPLSRSVCSVVIVHADMSTDNESTNRARMARLDVIDDTTGAVNWPASGRSSAALEDRARVERVDIVLALSDLS